MSTREKCDFNAVASLSGFPLLYFQSQVFFNRSFTIVVYCYTFYKTSLYLIFRHSMMFLFPFFTLESPSAQRGFAISRSSVGALFKYLGENLIEMPSNLVQSRDCYELLFFNYVGGHEVVFVHSSILSHFDWQ